MNWLASVLSLNYLDSLSSVFQREEQRNTVAAFRGEFPGCDHFDMNSDFSSSECLLDVLPLAVVFLLSCLSVYLLFFQQSYSLLNGISRGESICSDLLLEMEGHVIDVFFTLRFRGIHFLF